MDHPIDEGCITNQELAAWLKLVESDMLRRNSTATPLLPKASDPSSFSRTNLAIGATVAGSVALAWLFFLVWLSFKGISLF